MNISLPLSVFPTGIRRLDDIAVATVSTMNAHTLARDEYVLELKMRCLFTGDGHDFERGKQYAIDMLAYELYKDILHGLRKLRLDIHNGDKDAALTHIDQLEELMRGRP